MTRKGALLIEVSCSAYRRLLWLLPPHLRDRRGTEIAELFRDQLRGAHAEGGPAAAAAFWVRALAGLVRARLAGDPPSSPWLTPPDDGAGFVTILLDDCRNALRALRRSPGFAAIAILTLGLGIGATTAVFSLVHAILIEPLPYPAADRIVYLEHAAPELGFDRGLNTAPGLHLHYQQYARELDAIGYWRPLGVPLTGDTEPERVGAAEATAGLFEVLGARPLHGRLFGPDDDAPDSERAAVLGHGLWQRRYGADPAVVGTTVEIGGRPFVVVGVLPPDFVPPAPDIELWLDNSWDMRSNFGGFSVEGIGRRREGGTIASLTLELDALIGDIERTFADPEIHQVLSEAAVHSLPLPLKDRWVGDVRQTIWILFGTVGFVLLATCANVANLFLVRAESRHRETAVRAALGASRGRLVRLFLVESLMLAVIAGAAGMTIAAVGVRFLVLAAPVAIPRLAEVDSDATVLAFAAGLTLATGLLFGCVPALRQTGRIVDSLKEGGRGATTGRGRLRARQVLVVAQVALALVLLVGAGLMTRSFWRIRSIEPGFDSSGLLTFEIGLPGGRYRTPEDAARFHLELLDRLAELPGVVATGAASELPLEGLSNGDFLTREDLPLADGELPPIVWVNRVSADLFATLRVPVLAGRSLERRDGDEHLPVAVLNESAARLLWPGQDPLGGRVRTGVIEDNEDPYWFTVVGVVADALQRDLVSPPEPAIYVSLNSEGYDGGQAYTLSYVVRTEVPPTSLADAARRTVWAMDPGLPVVRLATMDQTLARASAPAAFTMLLLAIAAGVAVTLGAVGIYGVVSWVVRQRTSEIGIRLALGARSDDVLRMMLLQGLWVAGAGLAIGLGASWLLAGTLEALLYDVAPLDAVTHAAGVVVLLTVVMAATWLPARRAARIEPARSLRLD